jgi:hypothetical protein
MPKSAVLVAPPTGRPGRTPTSTPSARAMTRRTHEVARRRSPTPRQSRCPWRRRSRGPERALVPGHGGNATAEPPPRRLPILPHPNPIETRGTLTSYVMPAVPHPPGKAGCGIPSGSADRPALSSPTWRERGVNHPTPYLGTVAPRLIGGSKLRHVHGPEDARLSSELGEGKALIIERSAPHCTVCKLSEGLTRQRPPSAEGRLIHAGHRPVIASDSGQLGGALDLRGPSVFGGVENNPRPAPVALVPVDGVGRWTLHVVRRSSLEDPRRRGRYVRRPRGAGRQPRAPRRR